MKTQQHLAELIKQLIPSATETENTVTLNIQGISINYTKNKNITRVAKSSQNILR